MFICLLSEEGGCVTFKCQEACGYKHLNGSMDKSCDGWNKCTRFSTKLNMTLTHKTDNLLV